MKHAKKILLYGASGTGKTHFSLSYAKEMDIYGPILFIDTERGTDTLGDFNVVTESTLKSPSLELINVIDVKSYEGNQMDFVERIIGALKAGRLPYKTVIIDSITRLNSRNIQQQITDNPDVKRIKKGVPSQLDYRITQADIQRLLDKLEDINVNLLVIAWEYHIPITNEKGEITDYSYCPDLTGKMRIAVPYFFDVVCRLKSITSTVRKGYFAGTARFEAKVRHNEAYNGCKFPADIDNPTIQKIMSYYKDSPRNSVADNSVTTN